MVRNCKIVSIFYGLLWRRFGLIEFIGEKGWGTKVHSNTEEGMREEKKERSRGETNDASLSFAAERKKK